MLCCASAVCGCNASAEIKHGARTDTLCSLTHSLTRLDSTRCLSLLFGLVTCSSGSVARLSRSVAPVHTIPHPRFSLGLSISLSTFPSPSASPCSPPLHLVQPQTDYRAHRAAPTCYPATSTSTSTWIRIAHSSSDVTTAFSLHRLALLHRLFRGSLLFASQHLSYQRPIAAIFAGRLFRNPTHRTNKRKRIPDILES